MTLSITATTSDAKKTTFSAQAQNANGEPFPVGLLIVDSLVGPLTELVADNPRCLVEGDLQVNDDGFYLVIRNVTPAAPETYANSVVGVAGIGLEGRASSTGKTFVRGLVIGEGDNACWLNFRVNSSSKMADPLTHAVAGSRAVFCGQLAVSTPEQVAEGAAAKPYYYVQGSRFEPIANTSAPVAPEGTKKLVANEDDFPG